MEDQQAEFAQSVALEAEKYLSPDDSETLRSPESVLLEQATNTWVDIATNISPTRPTREEIRDYLQDVVKDVVEEIVTKHREVTVVTLTFATQQLVNHMIAIGWSGLVPFAIPLEILAAIIYTSTLKAIKMRL